MKNDRILRPIPLSLAGLFCLVAAACSGSALAATAPTLTRILQKDNINPNITMATGYEANKVAADVLGNVYVTDTQFGIIYKFNKNGHLARGYSAVYNPLGVSAFNKYDATIDKIITTVFAGGIANDNRTGFMLGQDGNVIGYFKRLPSDLVPMYFGHPNDIAIDASGNAYVADDAQNIVQEFDGNGIFVKTFGPYPANGSAKYFDSEVLGGATYYRTRHTMTAPTGITVLNGEMYVAFNESVDYLTVAGDSNCSLDATSCYLDTGNSYNLYSNTGSNYDRWYSIGAAQVVAVLDLSDGHVKRKITVYPFVTFTTSGGFSYRITDAAVDNSGRLYIATNSGMKVFNATIDNPRIDVSSAALSVNQSPAGSVPSGSVNGVAYDGTYNRLLISSGNIVTLFGIDTYTSPVNSAPNAPGLISPVSAYARSLSPSLVVSNAVDPENDPLTYGYEIIQADGTGLIESAAGIAEGTNGMTVMPVNAGLKENTRYRWRAQSNDGIATTWSAGTWDADKDRWAEFCVNVVNDNPEAPVIISPMNAAPVSPFGSTLSWNPSKDPDCYDTVSYVVEVSGDHGVVTSNILGTSISVATFAKSLTSGGTYNWRVKAVDNNGGASTYSSGSFTYKTTVVNFNSDQPGAKVYIDGNYGYPGRFVGTVPAAAQDMNPGSHFIAFVKAGDEAKAGYEPVYKIINVPDPLLTGGALTVTAGAKEWVNAERILPSVSAPLKDNSGVNINMSANSVPFVVDYNNDGVKDLIVGGSDGKVYLYNSQKQAINGVEQIVPFVPYGAIQFYSPDTMTYSDINVGSMAVPFAVDYNDDGRKDILVGSGDGRIYLYLNNGTDDAPVFYSVGTLKDASGNDIKAVSNSAPIVVDYNNDGRKDLVVGGSEGTLSLYLNIGDDATPVYGAPKTIKVDNVELNVGANADSRAFFTDWNADGKKDLVVGGNVLHLFLNVGTDESPDFRSITRLQQWIKDKKSERGNREYIPYLLYTQDLDGLVPGSTELVPFVVNWDGSSARDLMVGVSGGGVVGFIAE